MQIPEMSCCLGRGRLAEPQSERYTEPAPAHHYYLAEQFPVPDVPSPLPDEIRRNIVSRDLDSQLVVFCGSEVDLAGLDVVCGVCGPARRAATVRDFGPGQGAAQGGAAAGTDAGTDGRQNALLPTLGNSEFRAQNCRNCTFLVLESVRSVLIDKCDGCQFLLFCSGSVFVRECSDFRLSCVCRQLRLRGSSGAVGGLCLTAPVLERCSEVKIGMFCVFARSEEVVRICAAEARRCGVDAAQNKIDAVFDFTPPEDKSLRNYAVSELPCGVSVEADAPAQSCGVLPVWSCLYGEFGVNCSAGAAFALARRGRIVKALRLSGEQRREFGLLKREFELYVVLDTPLDAAAEATDREEAAARPQALGKGDFDIIMRVNV